MRTPIFEDGEMLSGENVAAWRNSMFNVTKYSNKKLYCLMDNNIFIWCFIEFRESQATHFCSGKVTLKIQLPCRQPSTHTLTKHTFLAIYPFSIICPERLFFLPLASFQIDL